MNNTSLRNRQSPSFALSMIPVAFLITVLLALILCLGASSVNEYGPYALLSSAAVAVMVAACARTLRWRQLWIGVVRSSRQLLPGIPVLIFIAMLSSVWMLAGIVPTLICYGLDYLNPDIFLFMACGVCAFISVLLGSSWTTIATVGVAFMGIGTVLGYSEGWIAGAIISGAYFGDKVSPLSDTTVLASSTCGVDIFKHIRYMLITTVPTMLVALAVFFVAGLFAETHQVSHSAEISEGLHDLFNISPWLLLVPVATIALCVMRIPSVWVLAISSLLGLVTVFVAQPHLIGEIADSGFAATMAMLFTGTSAHTGSTTLDGLVATGAVWGMLPTICLVLSAMVFGGALIGTGMLGTITRAITSRLHRRTSVVGATVGTGLVLNSCTADQYMSIIIGGNLYRNLYHRCGLEPRLLSRTLEDSISVTSVIIPWNSCGLTQSMVLGVSTLTYMPYCVFNYLSPIMSIIMARIGYKIPSPLPSGQATLNPAV